MARPYFMVIGAPGTGKSYEMLKALQDAYVIFTGKNNGHFYFTNLKKGKLDPKEYKLPKRMMLLESYGFGATKEDYASIDTIEMQKGSVGADGQPLPISAMRRVDGLIDVLIKKTREAAEAGQPPPYANVIIDEAGELLARVYAEILPTCLTNSGAQDVRGAFLQTENWVLAFSNKLRLLNSYGVGVGLVFHDREPDERAKGGAAAPSRGIARKLAAATDATLMRYMMDFEEEIDVGGKKVKKRKARRFWDGRASETWDIKLRGLDDDELDQITQMELVDILPFAGFDM